MSSITDTDPDSDWTIRDEIVEALREERTPEKLKELLEKYPDIPTIFGGRLGWALEIAIYGVAIPLIHHILKEEPNLANARKDISGITMLHSAVVHQNPEEALEMAKIFVSYGANVNLANGRGQTALFYSSRWVKYTQLTKFLLQKGAVIFSEARESILSSCLEGRRNKDIIRSQPENIQKALDEIDG